MYVIWLITPVNICRWAPSRRQSPQKHAKNLIQTYDNFKEIETSIISTGIYRVLHVIQMKLILLCVWAERAVYPSSKTALKFKYEI